MSTLASTTARPERCLIVHRRPTEELAGRLTIATCGKSSTYLFRSHPADGGVAYTMACESEPGKRNYTCTIGQSGNTCTCPGFSFRRDCKHCSALARLTARDAATAQMPPPAPRLPTCRVCAGTGFVAFTTAYSHGLSRCEACDNGRF